MEHCIGLCFPARDMEMEFHTCGAGWNLWRGNHLQIQPWLQRKT